MKHLKTFRAGLIIASSILAFGAVHAAPSSALCLHVVVNEASSWATNVGGVCEGRNLSENQWTFVDPRIGIERPNGSNEWCYKVLISQGVNHELAGWTNNICTSPAANDEGEYILVQRRIRKWLFNGAAITEATPVDSEGELLLCDNKGGLFGEQVCIHCPVLGKGTVGPESKDKITEITNLEGTSKNITNCTNDTGCPSPILAEALHLPWAAEAFESGTESRDLIGPGTGGEPDWLIECFGVADECLGFTDAKLENKEAEKDVLATFQPAVEPATCSRGGTGQGTAEGTYLIFSTGNTVSLS
jgi:hypothetical protein